MCYTALLNFFKSLLSGSEEQDDLVISSSAKVKCDWFRQQNTSLHHTDEYENDALVLRRGDVFNVGMTFEGVGFSEIMKTVFRIKVETKHAALGNINIVSCGIEDSIDDSRWGVIIVKKDPDELHIVVKINIPVNAAIGRYSVDVLVPTASSIPLQQSQIIILFNPWNPVDDVYLADEECRKEYILSDTGIIYLGSSEQIGFKRWNYGQFEENVLDCVLRLLERDKRAKLFPLKAFRKRNSPVSVARVLSAVINSQEDNGLLVGRWSGNYENGISPTNWSGSVEILQNYFKTDQPVKYGQCWVYSGCMTTALRALGIPARSVTNFDSAHDTDETMTIDVIYNDVGDLVKDLSKDSIWNFHVWNEIWTKRNDCPGNSYDGWQAVDATPQEESSGLHQMGPAPVTAVKKGEVFIGFDTAFVFSEVNADHVRWVVKKDNSQNFVFQEARKQNTRFIGKYISTKMVGKDEREDITDLYKYTEGSDDERKSFETAYSFGNGPKKWSGLLHVDEEGKEIILELSTTPISNGDDFTCTINVENTSNETLTVNLCAVISSTEYTGKLKTMVKRQKFEMIKINTGKKVKRELRVSADEYIHKLSDLNCFKLVVVANVLETGKLYVDESKLHLYNKDCIEIKFLDPKPLRLGQESTVEISFTNPLQVTLSQLNYCIEGTGLTNSLRKTRGSLCSGKKHTVMFSFTPRKPGSRILLVDIDSLRVKDFKSHQVVTVNQA